MVKRMFEWPKIEIYIYQLLPYVVALLIIVGILALIGLIIHVEYSTRVSWVKVIVSILIFSLSLGFGLHFLLILLGV